MSGKTKAPAKATEKGQETLMTGEQKAAAKIVVVLAFFIAICITGVLLYALYCGHNGIMTAAGIGVLGSVVGVVAGHKLRDILGK